MISGEVTDFCMISSFSLFSSPSLRISSIPVIFLPA